MKRHLLQSHTTFLLFAFLLMIVVLSFIQQFSFFISFNGFHLCLGYTLMLRLYLQWRKRLKHGTQTALTFLQFLYFILFLRDGIITFTFKSKHSFLAWLYHNMLLNKNQIPFMALPSKTCTFQSHFFTLGFPQRPTARD